MKKLTTHDDLERFFAALRKASAARPHERIGQLIVNAIPRTHSMPDLFYIDDDRLTARLDAFAESTLSQREVAGG